jgi:hypothetical protein
MTWEASLAVLSINTQAREQFTLTSVRFKPEFAESSGHVGEHFNSARPASIKTSVMTTSRIKNACLPNACTNDSPPTEAEQIYADLTVSFKRQHSKHARIWLSEMSCLRVQFKKHPSRHPKKRINLSIIHESRPPCFWKPPSFR